MRAHKASFRFSGTRKRAGRMLRTCLPARRYEENKKILLIPSPDLACEDAVMETEAFIKQ